MEKGFSETADGEINWFGSTWWSHDGTELDIARNSHNRDILTTAGYYFFHVRALSSNITKYNNSGYGELYRFYSDGNGNLSKEGNNTYTVTLDRLEQH